MKKPVLFAAGERVEGTVSAGSYLVKATCLEKATGSVEITVEAP